MNAVTARVTSAAITTVATAPALGQRLIRAAAVRGRSLVLCYHTIAPRPERAVVVDPVPPELFAAQLRALKDVADIVPLADLLSPRHASRPACAVTFDDDDPNHVRYALPILRELGIPATFFLSGRALHGLGPYWWTLLQQSFEEAGIEETCRRVGYRGRTLKELARACRRSATVKELTTHLTPAVMGADDIRQLAAAGMTIGFHTVHHPLLTELADAELERALTEGRAALASAAGTTVDLLAYPYGGADARVAAAAERSGYRAAFTLGNRPAHPSQHPFMVSRWQPGTTTPGRLVAEAALRFMLPIAACGQERPARRSDTSPRPQASTASAAA